MLQGRLKAPGFVVRVLLGRGLISDETDHYCGSVFEVAQSSRYFWILTCIASISHSFLFWE